MVIDMDNGAAITILRLLIHHYPVQGKGREEKEPAGPHGVVAIINNHHAKTLFDVKHFQALMPVVVTHGIGVKAAKRHDRVVKGNQFQPLCLQA